LALTAGISLPALMIYHVVIGGASPRDVIFVWAVFFGGSFIVGSGFFLAWRMWAQQRNRS
jgi:hypothetical protein